MTSSIQVYCTYMHMYSKCTVETFHNVKASANMNEN